MQPKQQVIDCYNKAAANYSTKFLGELEHKHLDQILLRSFAKENKEKGKLIDLGCGPGQTTKFLNDCGVTELVGTDLSPEMIAVAKQNNPALLFETADMLELNYPADSFGSAIAFYAIVHFDYTEAAKVFTQIKKILKPGGDFLFSFHVGDSIQHMDQFLDHAVSIDFHFLDPKKITDLLKQVGYTIVDNLIRQPYPTEHPTERAYIWTRK